MNGYPPYGTYDGNGMPQRTQNDANNMMMMGQDEMGGGLARGQSLDDIVNQNANAMRRQSMPQQYGNSAQNMDSEMRRISMMDYSGSSPVGSMGNFSYDPSVSMDQSGLLSGNGTPQHSHHQRMHGQRQSRDLNLDTNFATSSQGYNAMAAPTSAYASSAGQQPALDLSMSGSFVDPSLSMQMDYNDHMANQMTPDASQMNMYNRPQFGAHLMNSPIQQSPQHGESSSMRGMALDGSNGSGNGSGNTNSQYSRQSTTPTAGNAVRQLSRKRSLNTDSASPQGSETPHAASMNQPRSTPQTEQHDNSNGGFHGQPQHPTLGSKHDRGMHNRPNHEYNGLNGPLPVSASNYNPNNQGLPWEPAEGGWPSTMAGKPHMETSYKNAYSSTGFDMLRVLMRVAARPNPEINIGSVDLSCAFVVCDAEKDDFPIVYCSENFERLTGYTRHMILGRNCRFLQSPDGNVSPGNRRKYVDDDSVLYLKNMINLRRESQISLINYRRGGQPFMNLLTMIPITWDTDQVKFFVGFQVDLVEQPNAVTNRNPDGSYSINYQRGMTMPRYVMNAPELTSNKSELGQTVPRDDVSTILSTIGSGESEYAKRMWDKVMLENTDDVIHVLSLKGLFQWVSPSALRLLEYEPGEIIGAALSSVCHPSDIVPVTRELKDTSTGASVNVVFRIRRKNSGYMWFEGHGSLHTEQGKGRKSIIMVGRERPVYTLSKKAIAASGGIGENELWTKMSTSGMFLFVSSNVRQLLDRQPDELVGVSIQSLMRAESGAEFGRILEHARTGKRASVKHEMINRRGQVLSAFTTLYPGDANEGQKPTFIVAQTRLIKFSRGSQSARTSTFPKNERAMSETSFNTSNNLAPPKPMGGGDGTPNSGFSGYRYVGTNGSANTFSGQDGLVIGNQDQSLASDDNLFEELKTTKSSSWQYEIRQLEKRNRMLAEEVQSLIAAKKKRKRRKTNNPTKDCANCHTRVTPEWRRGPSGQRDLCNSCGLRWAKQNGRVSPRTSSQHSVHSAQSDKASRASASPKHSGAVAVKAESLAAQQSLSKSVTPRAEPRMSPTELHSAQMEGATGVPAKIDEGVEPK